MSLVRDRILRTLSAHMSPIGARTVLEVSQSRTRVDLDWLRPADRVPFTDAVVRAVKLYIGNADRLQKCIADVSLAIAASTVSGSGSYERVAAPAAPPAASSQADRGPTSGPSAPRAPVTSAGRARADDAPFGKPDDGAPSSVSRGARVVVPVRDENDIVLARGRGREMCERLGFSAAVQMKVATAISELARNIVQYAGTGEIAMSVVLGDHSGLEVVAEDRGPGIANVPHVMSTSYRSTRGLGIGLKGTKKMMDEFEIVSEPGKGTRVRFCKHLR